MDKTDHHVHQGVNGRFIGLIELKVTQQITNRPFHIAVYFFWRYLTVRLKLGFIVSVLVIDGNDLRQLTYQRTLNCGLSGHAIGRLAIIDWV